MQLDSKTIFITTPCLNMAQTIDQTINSIVTQEGDFSIRYHIQDSCSTDGSIDILHKWKKRLSKYNSTWLRCNGIHFSYASAQDLGMYDAIAKGFNVFEIPEFAFMTWLNADDILMPYTLLLLSALHDMHHINWITGNQFVINTEGEEVLNRLNPYPPADFIARGVCDIDHWVTIQQEGTFWRKWLWDKVGGIDNRFELAGDWDLWRRFARYTDIVQVDFPLGAFRQSEGQMSLRKNGKSYRKEIESVVPFKKRQEAIKDMAHIGINNLQYTSLASAGDHYALVAKPIGDSHACWCKSSEQTLSIFPSRHVNPVFISDNANWDNFTFSRRSHWSCFKGTEEKLYGSKIDPNRGDMRVYQELLVLSFIENNFAPGSKLLEVGGSDDNRLVKYLFGNYEVWRIAKLDSTRNEQTQLDYRPYRFIYDNIGNFNPQLPVDYFNFIFSISGFEHVPQNDLALFDHIIDDINRVLKVGGLSMHLFDFRITPNRYLGNRLAYRIFDCVRTINPLLPSEVILSDPDLYCVSENEARNNLRHQISIKNQMGRQLCSLNILWGKEMPLKYDQAIDRIM